MILKLESNENGWLFIDNIQRVCVEPTSVEKYTKDYGGNGRTWDGVYLQYYSEKDGTIVNKSNVTSFPVKEITAYFNDGGSYDKQSFLVDGVTYLMSDEGRTVERIN